MMSLFIPSHNESVLQYADALLKIDIKAFAFSTGFKNELEHLSESLRRNKEILLAAVQQNGLALQYVDLSKLRGYRLEKDRELKGIVRDIVFAAVQQNKEALKFVDLHSLSLHHDWKIEAACRIW